jgi:hypothetical protein
MWMKTNHCFPNNAIIPIDVISLLRIFQNLIVVVCFTTIFILYALICVLVSRRRQLKADRDQYYKAIMHRSKQNTMVTVCSNKSEQSFLMGQLPVDLNANDPLLDSKYSPTRQAKLSKETCLGPEDEENTKGTQTLNSAIAFIKKYQNIRIHFKQKRQLLKF